MYSEFDASIPRRHHAHDKTVHLCHLVACVDFGSGLGVPDVTGDVDRLAGFV